MYRSNGDLPQHILDAVPDYKGRNIWRAAFNGAQERGLTEEQGYAEAWAALEDAGYKKDPDTLLWDPDAEAGANKAGSFLKRADEERYTLGEVYRPDVVDSQGDFARAATIRKAQQNFMRALQGRRTLTKWTLQLLDAITKALKANTPLRLDVTDMVAQVEKAQAMLGDMHEQWDEGFGDIVECYCTPADMVINGDTVPEGTWLMGVVWSLEQFQKIKKGERTGFSMGGRSRRRWVEALAAPGEKVLDAA